MGPKSEQTLHQLRPLGSNQTCHSQDLPLSKLEGGVAETFGVDGGKVLHLKHHFPWRVVTLRIQLRQLPAYHFGDDKVRGQILGRPGSDVLAVPHDGHFVADAQNLVHLVADVDNRDAF